MTNEEVKIIAIVNHKFELSTYLGTDIVKQYIKDNTNVKVDCITYNLRINKNAYNLIRKKEFQTGEVVCEIGHLVNFLQLFKNIKDNVEDLSTGFTNLDDEQLQTVKLMIDEANNLDLTNIKIASFSIVYSTFLYLSLYAAILKRRKPDIKIVYGGYHITLSDNVRQFIYKSGLVDVVVNGDGCKPMVDIIKGKITKGIINSTFPIKPSLPEFTKIERLIHDGNFSCMTSLGCRFNCHFCASDREFIECDLIYITDYLKRQHKLKPIKFVNFADDAINPTIERGLAICKMMKHINGPNWAGHFVCSQFNDELIKQLVESKCTHVFLGTEAFSDDILEIINKNCNKKKYLETINKLCKAGIYITLGIICGMPGETEKQFEETFDVVKDLMNKYGSLIRLAPVHLKMFPGSRMYSNPEEFDIIFNYWSKSIIDKYWKYNVEEEFPDLLEIIYKTPFTFSVKNLPNIEIAKRAIKYLTYGSHMITYTLEEGLVSKEEAFKKYGLDYLYDQLEEKEI